MDKRVMKTRRAIHEAMTKLLTVKPIEEITVTELAEKAEINRKTFYNYYNSVYMVPEEMEDQIVARFEETLRKIDFDTLLKDPQTTFITLARLITEWDTAIPIKLADCESSTGANRPLMV